MRVRENRGQVLVIYTIEWGDGVIVIMNGIRIAILCALERINNKQIQEWGVKIRNDSA